MPHPKARALALFDDYVELPLLDRALALDALRQPEPELYDALRAMLDADSRYCVLDDDLLHRHRRRTPYAS